MISEGGSGRDNRIFVVGAVDDTYVQHLAVTYVSLLENVKGRRVCFFVIDDCISPDSKEKLRATLERYQADLEFLSWELPAFADLPAMGHLTRASYLRLLAGQLLPGYVDKVIYLDADTIVEGDISIVWDVDVSAYALAAVRDHEQSDRLRLLIGQPEGVYFNSGVMLLNLDRWRDSKTLTSLIDCVCANAGRHLFMDQDAANLVFQGQWVTLGNEWNVQHTMFRPGGCGQQNTDMWDRKILPAIIHYTGPYKPWRFLRHHPLRDRYYVYLKLTRWRSFSPRPTAADLRDFVKIHAKRCFPVLFARCKAALVNDRMGGPRISGYLCRLLDIKRSLP